MRPAALASGQRARSAPRKTATAAFPATDRARSVIGATRSGLICRQAATLCARSRWPGSYVTPLPEIDALVSAARAGGFSIAPDAAGTGTNALCLISIQPFQFQFGPDSQHLHLQEARRLGLAPQIVRLPGLELDIDSPADLNLLGEQQWRTRLRA